MQLLFLLILKLISHVNTQINIAKAVAKPTSGASGNDDDDDGTVTLDGIIGRIWILNIRMGTDWGTTT
jgi:hypothetical protein